MRTTSILALVIIVFVGCSKKDDVVKMENAEQYFPMEVGDTWHYTFSGAGQTFPIMRQVRSEIDTFGVSCMPVYDERDSLEECWRVDSEGFWIHLLAFRYVPDPPLLIPFDMRTDTPHAFDSDAEDIQNSSGGFKIKGKITFEGYVTKTVPAGTFQNCFKLRYDVEDDPPYSYHEYYAPNVGLLDNGDAVLDSAVVGGVTYP
ncbi:MAG: hypothetical protein KAT85_08205 [candidate division Zixibacteria bacterium]|nr:hypothetical protein [candidate division Zixibacteria bacterium]